MSNPFDLERAYFESEEKFKRLTQLMPVAVYSTDQQGHITFYNNKAVELWGRKPKLNDPAEFLYSGSWKLYDADGTPILHEKCPLAKALQDKKPCYGEEIGIERPDGAYIYALANIDLIYDYDGKIVGAINVLIDITDRKKAEEDRRWLAAIVSSSDDAIISKNLDSRITSWNIGAQQIFGYTEKEILGKSIYVLIPDSRKKEEALILGKIRNGERINHFETIRVTKSGKEIPVSLTVSPVKNSKGEVIGASKIARDIREQVKFKEQLKLYNKKLKELNKIKDDFLGLASHELKTPLTIIKAYLELLEMDVKGEEAKSLVEKSLLQTNKLTDMISDLLDVSRIGEGKLKLHFSTFNINELIEECIENLYVTNNTHQFLREGVTGDIPVTADRQRIEQVIFNLINNAVKYSSDSNKVVVTTELNDNRVVVKVKDFGPGIARDQRDKIFSRFFRVESQVNKVSGLGLGLYIAKEIVERHNGRIWVESEEGKGSVFCFEFPQDQANAPG